MTTDFVHLSVHSEYSISDGLLRVKELVAAAVELQMPAVALTDRANLFGFIRFYQACLGQGLKPIAGCDFLVANDDGERHRLICLAMSAAGYRNLIELVSRAYTRGSERGAVLESELFALGDDLIVLSGGTGGAIGSALLAGDGDRAEALCARYRERFGDGFYLELTRTNRPDEDSYLEAAVRLASAQGVPVVATNDVCFRAPDDFEAHETRVCIHEGRTLDDPRRERRHSEQQCFKAADAMAELFSDLPVALANAHEIAKRCNVALDLGRYYLPDYPTPDAVSLNDYLVDVAQRGLSERLAAVAGPVDS